MIRHTHTKPLNYPIILLSTFLALWAAPYNARGDDNLGAILKANTWDGIVGTWIDSANNESTFSWKYPDTVLQNVTKRGEVERYSMFWYNKATDKVNIASAASNGGSSQGTCQFSTGKSIFRITFTGADGSTGSFAIHYTLDGDSLAVEIEGKPESRTELTRKQ